MARSAANGERRAAVQPTDPGYEVAEGRVVFWLDPEHIRWIADHCLCGRGAAGPHAIECEYIRFRAQTALHKAGLGRDETEPR